MPHMPELTTTRAADADLSTHARKFARFTTNNGVALCGAGVRADGVIYQKPRATIGTAVGVIILGTAEVVAGAAVATGAMVTSDATGRAITAATGNAVNGTAMNAAAAAGDVIEVRLHSAGVLAP